jgi:hypothetical protein
LTQQVLIADPDLSEGLESGRVLNTPKKISLGMPSKFQLFGQTGRRSLRIVMDKAPQVSLAVLFPMIDSSFRDEFRQFG